MNNGIRICSEETDVVEAMMNVAKNKELTFEARVAWIELSGFALYEKRSPVYMSTAPSWRKYKELQSCGLLYIDQSVDDEILYISDKARSDEEYQSFVGDSLTWNLRNVI